MRIAIIGAGAAGCFCAINLKRRNPDFEVHVYEGATKPLAKVAVTGGGRCNLTNSFRKVSNLKDVYPRGDKLMRRMLAQFSHEDTMAWFEREGVRLVVQEDECVFPQSQDAMEIVNTLTRLMHREGVVLHTSAKVSLVEPCDNGYSLTLLNGVRISADKVVITTGGHSKNSGFDMLKPLNVKIESPVPSLFTFNVAGDWHQRLMGVVVEDAVVSIAGTKMRSQGALLLTHWGMSGPAILKLSSHAARWLAEHGYRCQICVNWFGDRNEEEVRGEITSMMKDSEQKLITSAYPRHLTSKHWNVLLERAGVPLTQRWGALNKKLLNKLITTLTADVYEVTGKCKFKEEFVTCGGVSLKEININTLESKAHPGVYFAGEVLDVDAVTGGFNLQAAWSMAWQIGNSHYE